MAQTFLQQARPPQLYGTSTASGNSVQQMVELLGKDHSLLSGNAADIDRTPAMDMYGVPCGPEITSRCGVPFEKAFRKDQRALFLAHIDQRPRQVPSECIGSFIVKQDTFHKFFGFSEGSYNSHSQRWPLSSEALPHHHTGIDDFTSTRPPDISSAEAEMETVTQEEDVHPTSNSPPVQANPTLLVPSPPVPSLSTNREVTQAEAQHIFREENKKPDPHRIVILRQVSADAYTVHTFNRHDNEGISRILPPVGEYLVSDENRSKRIRMTSARSIPSENVVVIADPRVREAFEEL